MIVRTSVTVNMNLGSVIIYVRSKTLLRGRIVETNCIFTKSGLYLYHNLPILQIHNNISHQIGRTDTDTDIHSWLFHNKISSNYCIPYMGKSVHVHDCLPRACITRLRCLAFVETG